MLQKARWGLGTRLVHVVVQFPGPAQLSATCSKVGEGLYLPRERGGVWERDQVGEGFLVLLKHGKSSSFTG